MSYTELNGDIFDYINKGKFDVVVHGCNCFCTMAAGIAKTFSKIFNVENYDKEHEKYYGDINKLGTFEGKNM